MRKPVIGDTISWIDNESGMRKTGVIQEIDDVVAVSNKFDIEKPSKEIKFYDLEEKSYQVECTQDKKVYSFLESEWNGEIMKPN